MAAQSLLNSLFQFKASVDLELLEALASVRDEASPADFRSALRVLNHAHIVDRIFASHLQRAKHGHLASWSEEVPSLADLSAAIAALDRWYLDYLSRIDADELEERLDFIFTDGARGRMSRAEMLAHVITHSGYHRGEVGRLLPDIEATAMRDVFAGYLHRAEPQRRH